MHECTDCCHHRGSRVVGSNCFRIDCFRIPSSTAIVVYWYHTTSVSQATYDGRDHRRSSSCCITGTDVADMRTACRCVEEMRRSLLDMEELRLHKHSVAFLYPPRCRFGLLYLPRQILPCIIGYATSVADHHSSVLVVL